MNNVAPHAHYKGNKTAHIQKEACISFSFFLEFYYFFVDGRSALVGF